MQLLQLRAPQQLQRQPRQPVPRAAAAAAPTIKHQALEILGSRQLCLHNHEALNPKCGARRRGKTAETSGRTEAFVRVILGGEGAARVGVGVDTRGEARRG